MQDTSPIPFQSATDLYPDDYAKLYPSRYEGVTARASERIHHAVDSFIETHPQQKTLTILDYGSGDGRYFITAEQIADYVKGKGIKVEYYAYEPTSKLLEESERRLITGKELGDAKNPEDGEPKKPAYQKAPGSPFVGDVDQGDGKVKLPDYNAPYHGPT